MSGVLPWINSYLNPVLTLPLHGSSASRGCFKIVFTGDGYADVEPRETDPKLCKVKNVGESIPMITTKNKVLRLTIQLAISNRDWLRIENSFLHWKVKRNRWSRWATAGQSSSGQNLDSILQYIV
ncbi:MAG: hypothetical protein WAV20_15740 [Blastocatellia bacterium]